MDNHLAKYIAFARTAEKGSFTKAAEDLNYAQSSVSKMIADLERDWGVTLLERSRSGVTLTPAGQQILPLVSTVINDCRKLDGVIGKINGIQTGSVRIGTFASVAINWLPDIFTEFQKKYPKISCEMMLGDYREVEQWITDGRVDCGFLPANINPSFDCVPLIRDEYKVILPENHPLSTDKTVDIAKLDGQPFLLLERGGKTEVSALLEKYNVHPDIRFTTWEDFAVMAMAEKGLGVGILPSLILRRIPYNIAIRPLKEPFYRDIGVCFRNRKILPPAADKFIEYLTRASELK